jgi:hypothetical protein
MKLLLPQFQEACGQTAGQQTIKEQSLTVRKDYDQTRQVQTTYQENLQGISDAIHPFSLSYNSPNDAEKVEGVLETRAKAIERLAIYLTTIN